MQGREAAARTRKSAEKGTKGGRGKREKETRRERVRERESRSRKERNRKRVRAVDEGRDRARAGSSTTSRPVGKTMKTLTSFSIEHRQHGTWPRKRPKTDARENPSTRSDADGNTLSRRTWVTR